MKDKGKVRGEAEAEEGLEPLLRRGSHCVEEDEGLFFFWSWSLTVRVLFSVTVALGNHTASSVRSVCVTHVIARSIEKWTVKRTFF
jgi:hypothetical protein